MFDAPVPSLATLTVPDDKLDALRFPSNDDAVQTPENTASPVEPRIVAPTPRIKDLN